MTSTADMAASVMSMHWLDTHQSLILAIGIGIIVVALLLLMRAIVRILRQGRRAMFGAHPVMGPPEFVNSSDGGLVLVVSFANASVDPAVDFRARVRTDGASIAAPTQQITLFGFGAAPEASRVRMTFDWPVGTLEAQVTISWHWTDGAGEWDDRWSGQLRVPLPELPPAPETIPTSGIDLEDFGRPDDPLFGKEAAEEPTAAREPRIDPLSQIRGGTAKTPKPSESGE